MTSVVGMILQFAAAAAHLSSLGRPLPPASCVNTWGGNCRGASQPLSTPRFVQIPSPIPRRLQLSELFPASASSASHRAFHTSIPVNQLLQAITAFVSSLNPKSSLLSDHQFNKPSSTLRLWCSTKPTLCLCLEQHCRRHPHVRPGFVLLMCRPLPPRELHSVARFSLLPSLFSGTTCWPPTNSPANFFVWPPDATSNRFSTSNRNPSRSTPLGALS